MSHDQKNPWSLHSEENKLTQHHIWVVQGPAKPEITAIRRHLASLREDKSWLFPENRVNFWFERPFAALQKIAQDLSLDELPVFMPWEIPTGYEGTTIDPDLDAVSRKLNIRFVPVPEEIMAGVKRIDNFYTKPYAHGSSLAGEFNQDDFNSFIQFNKIMASAVAHHVDEQNMAPQNVVINVQNKYLLGVPKALRQMDATRDSVISYFSHIPLVATSKPTSFDVVHPDVKKLYTDSLTCCDFVNCHTDQQTYVFAQFVARNSPKVSFAENQDKLVKRSGKETQLGSIFLGISPEKWVDIIRSDKAWEIAKIALNAMDNRQSATMFGRLDVFKGLDAVPLIVEQLIKNNPEHKDNFVFTNIYGRINPKSSDGEDPFTKQLLEIQKTQHTAEDNLMTMAEPPQKSPFLKFELKKPDGTAKEFLGQDELGGVMIATMLSQGVIPVTSTEEGLHMGVLEFIAACSYYLLDNPNEFKEKCVKHLGMPATDPRIANASVVAWVSRYSGAAHYLVNKADKAAFLMDPNDIDYSETTLKQALDLPRADRLAMLKRAQTFIHENTPDNWVEAQIAQGQKVLQRRQASAHYAYG